MENISDNLTGDTVGELVKILKNERSYTSLLNACIKIGNLSEEYKNKVAFVTPQLGLLNALIDILTENEWETRIHACRAIRNISSIPENRAIMMSPKISLLPVIIQVIQDENENARLHACVTAYNLASCRENKEPMASPELGLIPALIKAIKNDKAEAKIYACGTIAKLLVNTQNMIYLPHENEHLYQCIVEVILEDQGDSRMWACAALRNLVCIADNQYAFIDPQLRILEALSHTIRNDTGHARVHACASLANLFGIAYIQTIKDIIHSNIHIEMINALRAAGSDPTLWTDEYPQNLTVAFMILSRYSFGATALITGNLLDVILPLLRSSSSSGRERVKAAFIIIFLTGDEEAVSNEKNINTETNTITNTITSISTSTSSSTSLSVVGPIVLGLVIDVYNHTLNSRGGDGYKLGEYNFKLILSAILVLCLSDTHRGLLVSSPILYPLMRTLELFIANSPSISSCGGGGEDISTAAMTIEILLQLSFFYENDTDLIEKYMTVDKGIRSSLEKIITMLPEGNRESLPIQTLRSANYLLNRLQNKTNNNNKYIYDANKTISTSKYLILSHEYGIKQDLVMEIAIHLQSAGFEILVDEEGHGVLIPDYMDEESNNNSNNNNSNNNNEYIVDTVCQSQGVIIFVTSEYKQSANCRMEAKYINYARTCCKNRVIPLYYIILDEKEKENGSLYMRNVGVTSDGVVSTNGVVTNGGGGWLYNMINTENRRGDSSNSSSVNVNVNVCYPMWDSELIQSNIPNIIDRIRSRDNAGNGNGNGNGNSSSETYSEQHHTVFGDETVVPNTSAIVTTTVFEPNESKTPHTNVTIPVNTANVTSTITSSAGVKEPLSLSSSLYDTRHSNTSSNLDPLLSSLSPITVIEVPSSSPSSSSTTTTTKDPMSMSMSILKRDNDDTLDMSSSPSRFTLQPLISSPILLPSSSTVMSQQSSPLPLPLPPLSMDMTSLSLSPPLQSQQQQQQQQSQQSYYTTSYENGMTNKSVLPPLTSSSLSLSLSSNTQLQTRSQLNSNQMIDNNKNNHSNNTEQRYGVVITTKGNSFSRLTVPEAKQSSDRLIPVLPSLTTSPRIATKPQITTLDRQATNSKPALPSLTPSNLNSNSNSNGKTSRNTNANNSNGTGTSTNSTVVPLQKSPHDIQQLFSSIKTPQSPQYEVRCDDSPIEVVWASLHDPARVKDPLAMARLLSDLGLVEPVDLLDCSRKVLEYMSTYFKPVAKKAFLKSLKMSYDVTTLQSIWQSLHDSTRHKDPQSMSNLIAELGLI
eukprot:gene12007-25157_t